MNNIIGLSIFMPRTLTPVIGEVFGRLTIVRPINARSVDGSKQVECLCSCGRTCVKKYHKLCSSKQVKSCGCLRGFEHGECKKGVRGKMPEYNSWSSMRDRCRNINNINYKHYGGRGITICERWGQYSNFLQDMGRRPSLAYSLDRIDVNGNYEPSNCRWGTKVEQAAHTRQWRVTAVRLQELFEKERQYDAYRASIGVL